MAELVFHDTEDTHTQYPRAPPPSPEAQQRSLGSVFEIPDRGFDPLDLRQQDFAVALDFVLTHNDVSRANSNPSPLSTVPERDSPCNNDLTEDDEEYLDCPGSPTKRVCNSPCSFPEGYDSQLTSTHQYSWTSPLRSHSPPSLSSRSSNSPAHANTFSVEQTSPYSIPQNTYGMSTGYGREISMSRNVAVSSDNCALSPPPQVSMLSKSCDLPSACPLDDGLDAMVTECRTRSYTLGTSNLEEHTNQRRRKVSLKRTKEERDCELQFSFEYSNGSSEESDWLLVDQDTTALPIEKKACQPRPSSRLDFDINNIHQHFMYPPEHSASPNHHGYHSHHGYQTCSSHATTQDPAYLHTAALLSVHTASQLPPPLVHVDSEQLMDTCDAETRLDSLDSMECGPAGQTYDNGTHTTHTLKNPLIRLPVEVQTSISAKSFNLDSQVSRHSFIGSVGSNVLGATGCPLNNDSINFSKSL